MLIPDNLENEEMKRVLERALKALAFLGREFNINWNLNVEVYDDKGMSMLANMIYHNDNITPKSLKNFQDDLTDLRATYNPHPELVKEGFHVVLCIDDTNKPLDFDGDWIKKGVFYIVEDTRLIKNSCGEYGYVLKDLRPAQPYNTYNFRRFITIIDHDLNN